LPPPGKSGSFAGFVDHLEGVADRPEKHLAFVTQETDGCAECGFATSAGIGPVTDTQWAEPAALCQPPANDHRAGREV
jgi:hypothetical protein